MIYEFKSKDGKIFEEYFKAGKCPKKITRKKVVYYRIFSLPDIIMDPKQPKTVGSLADKNTRDREKKYGKPKSKPKPWWWNKNQKKPDVSLANLTPKQKEKYIMTGKK